MILRRIRLTLGSGLLAESEGRLTDDRSQPPSSFEARKSLHLGMTAAVTMAQPSNLNETLSLAR